jgi:hypothetical protein
MTNRQDSRFARPTVARRVTHEDVRHELDWFEDYLRAAAAIGGFPLIAHLATLRQRQAPLVDGGACNVSVQALQFAAFVTPAGYTSV